MGAELESVPAGGISATTRGRRFLTPSGYRSTPPREVPRETNASCGLDLIRATTLRDEQELVRAARTLRDEPECVDSEAVATYTEAIRTREALARQQAIAAAQALRPLLPAEKRLQDAQRRAKHAHRNLTGEFHVIARMLEHADRGGRKPPRNALDRLERIEAKLDDPLAA